MVSVIIPTFNAMPGITDLLSALKGQTVPCEIIVIDSSSPDNTARAALSLDVRVMSVEKKEFNHGRTRNLAVEHAAGDIVVFLTQDALPVRPDCIERLVQPLEDREIAASYGRQTPRDDARPTEKFARHFNYPPAPSVKSWEDISRLGIKAFFFSNVCSAVRKKEFMDVGRFPEDLIMFEDMLLAARVLKAGYRIAYVPGAEVIHSHDYGWREQFGRYAAAGVSFARNQWFLEHAKAHGEGVTLLRKEVAYFLKQGMYYWGLYALVEALFKYCGYRYGLKLPHGPAGRTALTRHG